jgi:asparagine synthase (glutamine-hydrolysing)
MRLLSAAGVTLWIARQTSTHNDAALLAAFVEFDRAPAMEALQKLLSGLGGHFAIVARGAGWTAGAVDRSRTIPLFIADGPTGWRLGFDAAALVREAGFGLADVDADGALSLAMAGYTTGGRTLYRDLTQLRAGECVFMRDGDEAAQRGRYHLWRPWRVDTDSGERARRDLADLTIAVMARVLDDANGRQIAVPLSAGYDSRLIVSALKILGAHNVVTFAYGLPGNFEMRASREIAERLGFPWRFVPLGIAEQSRFFRGDLHADYLDYADTFASTPFEQDLLPVSALRKDGFIAADAVLVNGNSGDFISGNHIPPSLLSASPDLTSSQRRARICSALVDKHYSLWTLLNTPERNARIVQNLEAELADIGVDAGDAAADYGLYEYLEFVNRQTKYVVSGQRVYEFLGHDWSLPLWDDDYLGFWERMPLALKARQRLYREMLEAENWGGVWPDISINSRSMRPLWLIPLRAAGKLAAAPFGAKVWHAWDHRLFSYWYELLGNYAVVPYGRVVADRRGFRNAISWHTEAYLAAKGLGYDGLAKLS